MQLAVWSLLPLLLLADSDSSGADRKEGQSRAYFYVAEGSKKCFYENTPASLPVTVTYASSENPGVSCTVSVSDPKGRDVDSKEVTRDSTDGRLTYLTKQVGQHAVCVSCPSSKVSEWLELLRGKSSVSSRKWFGTSMIKWTLSVDLGDTEINLAVR